MDGPHLPAGFPGECKVNWPAGTTSPLLLMSLLSQILPLGKQCQSLANLGNSSETHRMISDPHVCYRENQTLDQETSLMRRQWAEPCMTGENSLRQRLEKGV